MSRVRRTTESPESKTAGTTAERVVPVRPPAGEVAADLLGLHATGGNQMVLRLLGGTRAGPPAPGGELRERISAQLGRGEPLPADLRTQAQSDLGEPLGGVRLHRDATAATLAGQLDARAFTTGRDVFFGAGEYDPSSARGYAVLTHELAHTVQQSSGAVAAEEIAPGVAVSTPGDRDERAATRAAAHAVTRRLTNGEGGEGGAAPSGVMAGAGTGAAEIAVQRLAEEVAPIVLQRYDEDAKIDGMGSGFGASSVHVGPVWGVLEAVTSTGDSPLDGHFLPFDGRIETVPLSEAVTGGRIEFHVFEQARINNLLFDNWQSSKWDMVVPFVVEGRQATFGSPLITKEDSGSGATASVNVGSGATPVGGYATFVVSIAAAGSGTTGGSLGGGVGPYSASGSVPYSSTANFAGGLTRSFTVNLRPTPPVPVPGPDSSFHVGSAALEDGQEAEVTQWFQKLPPAVQEGIRTGKRSITVSGYASTTGGRSSNRGLSEQRAKVVERILRGFAGSAATINIFFLGEDQATTPDETEDPQWRRATIIVQVPSGTAPGAPGPPSR